MTALAFLRPELLWLLCAIPVLWIWPRRVREPWHAVLRSVVVALAICALAAPVRIVLDDTRHQVVIVDLSVGNATHKQLR